MRYEVSPANGFIKMMNSLNQLFLNNGQGHQRAATSDEVETALFKLESNPGIYFGVDAGIEGMHPLQATLVAQASLQFDVYEDGIELQALSKLGHQLLHSAEVTNWIGASARGSDRSVQDSLQQFLALFEPSENLLLSGAFQFDAHKLHNVKTKKENETLNPLGVLFFAEKIYRRQGPVQSAWELIDLSGDEASKPSKPAPQSNPNASPQDDMPPGGYAQMVLRAIDNLKSTDLVSLTLSQAYRKQVSMLPTTAFNNLRQANPAPACFFVNNGRGLHLLGASPDLQLVIQNQLVQSLPVCGTVAKRSGPMGEAFSLQELINEDVDAASLSVCTDALRNDLAPFCKPGSLTLLNRRKPMVMSTVVHTVDRIQGELKANVNVWDVILATAAPVMVTGTPRKEAVKLIEKLEASPRAWYGGLVVQVSSKQTALVGTILRAAAVENGVAQVRTGGDLMADSSPEREEQESRLKTLSVWRAFGLAPAAMQASQHITANPLKLQIHLHSNGDAFASSMQDCLESLGAQLVEAAGNCTVLIGNSLSEADLKSKVHCVAIGNIAYQLLAQHGWPVKQTTPENGRVSLHQITNDAPTAMPKQFISAKYAGYSLQPLQNNRVPDGWQIWTTDQTGTPSSMVHPSKKIACILFRPDSMMSDDAAKLLLKEALHLASP